MVYGDETPWGRQGGNWGTEGLRQRQGETGKDSTKLGILRKIVRTPKRYLLVLFFDDRKLARLLIQVLYFLCFSRVATVSNLFLSTSNSLPTCWYSSIPGIFSIVYISW